jgi:hypothetical protein
LEIDNGHARVHAEIVIFDHDQRVVLLSMAGPRTAVKGIYAALRSNQEPWLTVLLDEEGGKKAVRGGRVYRSEARALPSVRGVQMVVWAEDPRATVGYFFVWEGESAEEKLVKALESDPRVVVPVVAEWGRFLMGQAREKRMEAEAVRGEVLERLVQPMGILGSGATERAFVYARDTDSWISVIEEGLQSGAIVLKGAERCD